MGRDGGQQQRSQASRRDRHGRGLRGPLAPASVPLVRTRAALFDEIVASALETLSRHLGQAGQDIEILVEDVPPPGLLRQLGPGEEPPISASFAEHGSTPPRVVLYRRPLTRRAGSPGMAREMVLDSLVHEVAALLRVPPDTVDPR